MEQHSADRAVLAYRSPSWSSARAKRALSTMLASSTGRRLMDTLQPTVASSGGSRHERAERGTELREVTEGFVTVVTARAALRAEARAGARRFRAARAFARCRWRRPKWRGCSICAAASSRPSIFAGASGCAARRWPGPLAVGIEKHGELYGIIVDRVGDVLWLERSTYEANPVNLDRALGASLRRRVSARDRPDGRARRRQGARSQWSCASLPDNAVAGDGSRRKETHETLLGGR